MKRLACCLVSVSLVLAACGDNRPGGAIDGGADSMPADTGTDTPAIDAMIDAMPTPSERIALARALPDGTTSFPIVDATITYIKPFVTDANPNNDPGGFTIQVDPTGPALMIEADVTTLTPAPAVGDVVSFTIGEMKTAGTNGAGLMRRGAAITNYTRTTAATDVAPLVQDITAVTGVVGMVGDLESELVDVTAATIAEAWGNSGSAYQRTRITTAGVTTVDQNFQLRIPQAFRESLEATYDLEVNCVVAIHRTPVNRFAAQLQVSAFTTTDLTVTSCPTPTVASAAATGSTTVTVSFSRNIDMATVMANGSQFTITETATPANTLAVTAAALTGPSTVTLTTAAQTSGTSYTVTVGNTVEDVTGGAIGTPNTATFNGFAAASVMMAAATAATTVTVTFTGNVDVASVMTDGSQFTIVDDATPTPNTLAVSAASVSGMVVTLTTAAQTPSTMYTVTVANTVTSGGSPVIAPLTGSFLGFVPSAGVDHLVINEVDYDQSGTDANSFIEIYNPTNAAIPLADFAVVYLNGGANGGPAGTAYGTRVMLSAAGTDLAAGGYLLIRNSTVAANGALTIDVSGDFLQNGPDGIALINTSSNTLVDALHYAHPVDGVGMGITAATIAGFAATVSLVEGTAFATADTQTGSLGRFPNGADTNNASVDWSLRTTPSPGMTN